MSFWEALKEHNKELLTSQIKTNGGQCDGTIDSIIANIGYLAETGESFGEEKKFLRLDIRRAIATLSDTGRIIFKPANVTYSENKKVCTVGGFLYEVKPDGSEVTISSYAVGGAVIEDVYSQEMMSDEKRSSSLLALATARAESKALFNAGIGIEFKGGDVFNLEALEQQIQAPEPVMPSPASQEEKKAKRGRASKKTQETSQEPVNAPVKAKEENSAPVPAETNLEASESVTDTSETSNVISYEDALKEIVDVGNYKGKTIGDVLSTPQTARNIVWCFKQDVENRSERTREALKVAIDNYEGGVLKRWA